MSSCTDAAITFIRREDVFTDATSMSWIPIVHPMSALSWLIVSVFELLLFILVGYSRYRTLKSLLPKNKKGFNLIVLA